MRIEFSRYISQCRSFKIFPSLQNQILREINFEESRSSKTAYFAILGALKFEKAVMIHKNQNSEPLIVLKWQIFDTVDQATLISRKI